MIDRKRDGLRRRKNKRWDFDENYVWKKMNDWGWIERWGGVWINIWGEW